MLQLLKSAWQDIKSFVAKVSIRWVFGVRTLNATVGDHNHVVYVGDIEHANFVLTNDTLARAIHRFCMYYPKAGGVLLQEIHEESSRTLGVNGTSIEMEALTPFLKANDLHISRKELNDAEALHGNGMLDCDEPPADGLRNSESGGKQGSSDV